MKHMTPQPSKADKIARKRQATALRIHHTTTKPATLPDDWQEFRHARNHMAGDNVRKFLDRTP